jgi:hypothetical protein
MHPGLLTEAKPGTEALRLCQHDEYETPSRTAMMEEKKSRTSIGSPTSVEPESVAMRLL